jgi:DNA mismatch repair protein MutS
LRFHSILFDQPSSGVDDAEPNEPATFGDLNLDQVLASMTSGREEYDLKPFFYTPLRDVAAVRYRHEILRDLQKTEVLEAVGAFAERLQRMRKHLAQASKLYYRYQRERWFLDAVRIYCDAVSSLAEDLLRLELTSRGFQAFRDYLTDYAASDGFTSLAHETRALGDALAGVQYAVHIRGSRVTVSSYDGEPDYSAEVEATFAKFKQGAVKDYRVKLPDWVDMNHVEAQVLDRVARLHPEVFGTLNDYCARHRGYLDPAIGAFDREVQFYLAYLAYIERFRSAGLPFCYPRVSARSKEVAAEEAFDLALAGKLVPGGSAVVRNDFHLEGPERILVVTGPNQGGKTTFARMFGQLHYLASLGLPVPGRNARLFLPDQVLKFQRGVLLSAQLGKGNKGIRQVLRRLPAQRWMDRVSRRRRSGYSFQIPDRDDNGARALLELRGKGINLVANTLAQSTDHILSFLGMLRAELAFYVGCLNLRQRLADKGEPTCFPVPVAPGEGPRLSARSLYDVCLTLHLDRRVVRALIESGIKVMYVTHLFDLAQGFYLAGLDSALFLRAERQPDGGRTYRLVEGEPLPTSFGEDAYRRIFGTAVGAAPGGVSEVSQ